jgi:hypothetical protein
MKPKPTSLFVGEKGPDVPLIAVLPIEGTSFELYCPACREWPLFVAYADYSAVPSGCWLDDGDTVSGVWDELTPSQKSPNAFDYSLMVGRCVCRKRYYVVTAAFMDTNANEAREWLHFNREFLGERNYRCLRTLPAGNVVHEWLLQEFATPLGPMRYHVFGPFRLKKPKDVIGPHGVTSCGTKAGDSPWTHARELLLEMWDDMRSIQTPGPFTHEREQPTAGPVSSFQPPGLFDALDDDMPF